MAVLTLSEILIATDGTLVGSVENTNADSVFSGVSTDTRTIFEGNLFIALIGERFDGHNFCQTAQERGARGFIVSRAEAVPPGAIGILVADTLSALLSVAQCYRKKLNARVIAVTGSVGKTTTREMLAYAFSSIYRTHATKQNLNNEIGMSLTLLSAPVDTELLIVEMGMRKRGEILALTKIAEPDIAIITNAGVSHIERLGSRDEILRAKTEICEGIRDGGLLLVNGDDERLPQYALSLEAKSFRIGVATLDGKEENAGYDLFVAAKPGDTDGETTKFTAEIVTRDKNQKRIRRIDDYAVRGVGLHFVRNALFAILCAVELGADSERVKRGLLSYQPTGSRGKLIRTPRYLLYDDAYNASPESMAAAFESIRILAKGRRTIAAIGGILELGEHAESLHREVGEAAGRHGIDKVFVFGEYAESVKEGVLSVNPNAEVLLFADRDALITSLLPALQPGDVVLAKGSHAFAMDAVIKAILEREELT